MKHSRVVGKGRWVAAAILTLAMLSLAPGAFAGPLATDGRDWEGCSDFVDLARGEVGAHVVPTARLDFSQLSPDDALILLYPEHPLDVPSLAGFIHAGGRVAVFDDYGQSEPLLRYFGIERVPLPAHPAEELRHNPALAIAEPAGTHEAVAGVSKVVLNHATGLRQPALSPVLVVRGRGEPDVLAAVAGLVNKGRFIAIGDPAIVMNSMLRYPGNKTFARNVIRYVAAERGWTRNTGRLFIASGAFDGRGSFGAPKEGGDLSRSLHDTLLSLQDGGVPPLAAYFLSVALGLGVVLWTGSNAGRFHRASIPRFTRAIPLAAQGGLAGHAAVVGRAHKSHYLAILELKSALEEEFAVILGLERAPGHDGLQAFVKANGLLDREGRSSLRRLLLRMSEIETMMLSGRAHALRRIRDHEVLVTAQTVKELLSLARQNAKKGAV